MVKHRININIKRKNTYFLVGILFSKQLNLLDFGFEKKMFEGKDEGQKMIIYKAAYDVYKSLIWINMVAFMIAFYSNKFFNTGFMAVILICLSWLAETIIYLRASYKYKNKGLE